MYKFLKYIYYKFSIPKFAKYNSKNSKVTFFIYSPGNLLIIFYQLTKFEAPSCNSVEISGLQNFILTFEKGQNSTMGDNSD